MNARYHPRYDLAPDTIVYLRAYLEWAREYQDSPNYQTGDSVLGISAGTDSLGGAIIRVDIHRGSRLVTYSPYYNQFAYDCEPDERSENEQINENPQEWLSTMAMATDWHEGVWTELGSCPYTWSGREVTP